MFIFFLIVILASTIAGVIVYAVWTASYLKGLIAATDISVTNPWLITIVDIASALAFGIGTFVIVSPAILYWWIHGDYERYLWIIRGPSPYNQFGGGPFQLWMYILLVFLGLVMISGGIILRRWFYRQLGALIESRHYVSL